MLAAPRAQSTGAKVGSAPLAALAVGRPRSAAATAAAGGLDGLDVVPLMPYAALLPLLPCSDHTWCSGAGGVGAQAH